jgi:hypothetical protein
MELTILIEIKRKIASNSKPIKEELYLATEINDYSLSQLQLDRLEMALTKIKPEESMILKLKYQEGASVKRYRKYWVCPKPVKMRVLRAKSKL